MTQKLINTIGDVNTCVYRPVTIGDVNTCVYRPVTIGDVNTCVYRPVTIGDVNTCVYRPVTIVIFVIRFYFTIITSLQKRKTLWFCEIKGKSLKH